jgi:hypothetical protein
VHATLNVAMVYRAFDAGASTIGVPSLSRNDDGWSSGVQVQNLGAETTSVTLRLLAPDGLLVTTESQEVAAEGSYTFYLPALDAVSEGWRGAGVISSSSEPIAVVVNEVRY